jgi:hypothetical protein
MKTREEKQFSVNFAHTGGLMKSVIPRMQRILNKDESTDKETNKRKNIDENPGIKKRKPG